MDKCKSFCEKDYIQKGIQYATKYQPKNLKYIQNPFIQYIIKEGCKEDYCNQKCKYTASRKKAFMKLKKKYPILSYCRKSVVLEKNKNRTKKSK